MSRFLLRLMGPIPWAWNEQTTTLNGLDVSRTDVRGIRAGNSAPGDRPCPDARGGPALAIGGLRPLVQRAISKGDGTPGAVTGHVRLWH